MLVPIIIFVGRSWKSNVVNCWLWIYLKHTCLHKFGGDEKVDWQYRHLHCVGEEWDRFWWVKRALFVANTFPHPSTEHFETLISLWLAELLPLPCPSSWLSSSFSKSEILILLKDVILDRWWMNREKWTTMFYKNGWIDTPVIKEEGRVRKRGKLFLSDVNWLISVHKKTERSHMNS